MIEQDEILDTTPINGRREQFIKWMGSLIFLFPFIAGMTFYSFNSINVEWRDGTQFVDNFRLLEFVYGDFIPAFAILGIILTLLYCLFTFRRSLAVLWLIPWQVFGLGTVLVLWWGLDSQISVAGTVSLEDTTYRLVTTNYDATLYSCDGWQCWGRVIHDGDSRSIHNVTLNANQEAGELIIHIDSGEIIITPDELPTYEARIDG